VRVGGIPYSVEKMKLYLISDIDLAIEIKEKENCPHIHFIVEPHCDAFTTSMVWLEVLSRGVQEVQSHKCCVISYIDLSSHQDSLTNEEVEIVQKIQKKINQRLDKIQVIRK
jgi:hypothetical protein